ncbi:MAG: hypothetical protein NTX65_06415 [Ignavibacteriales bacterium]|nr:hypothetical protein [Ignavibacteriales bacterium]
MPNSVNKAKHLSAKTNFWERDEIPGQPLQDESTEIKKSVIAFFELPINWWSSHSSFGAANKLKRVDLIKLNREKIDKLNLSHSTDWQVGDGDYKSVKKENEENRFLPFEARRRLKKILLGVALVLAALIIWLFSFMVSSIKNF